MKSLSNILNLLGVRREVSCYPKKMDKFLTITVDGEVLKFPFVWLRDNCLCEQCFHPTARSRTYWSDLHLNIKPKEIVQDKDSIQVTWEDEHKSNFKYNWLKIRSFTPEGQRKYDEVIYKPAKITWHGEEFNAICSNHDYNDIVKTDEALYNWLNKLAVYGVTIIKNTPNSETAIDAIIDRIAFTKRTHYGVKFVVQHTSNTNNLAYLSDNLQMHTDLPYYEYGPGINLLHCFVQTVGKGGENLLVDGHYIAKYIKKTHPVEYKLLTEVDIEWNDLGTEDGREFFKLYRAPIITLDKYGEVQRINFSVPQRSSHFLTPIELIEPWYRAYSLFLQLCHKFAGKFKSVQGDILVFDNIRLVHSRMGYVDNGNNVRKIIGAYIDWDEIYCKLRYLIMKLGYNKGMN